LPARRGGLPPTAPGFGPRSSLTLPLRRGLCTRAGPRPLIPRPSRALRAGRALSPRPRLRGLPPTAPGLALGHPLRSPSGAGFVLLRPSRAPRSRGPPAFLSRGLPVHSPARGACPPRPRPLIARPSRALHAARGLSPAPPPLARADCPWGRGGGRGEMGEGRRVYKGNGGLAGGLGRRGG
jgi:hypothetical protein